MIGQRSYFADYLKRWNCHYEVFGIVFAICDPQGSVYFHIFILVII